MTGRIVDKTGKPLFPPKNRTDWNGAEREEAKKLDAWTRKIGFSSPWDSEKCMAAFTAKPNDVEGEKRLHEIAKNVTSVDMMKRYYKYVNKPVAVDAPPLNRLMESMAHRKDLCIYDHELQKTMVFHLMGDGDSGARMLVHFYAYLFFENWKQDAWTKRFVRDHLRYTDEIQCAAARVVHAMREISKKNGNGGVFDTFHIRRGDFQYKDTVRICGIACCVASKPALTFGLFLSQRVDIDIIYKNTKDLLEKNSTIYIATDERDKPFFKLLRKHYKIYFMDDFKDVLKDVNTNYFGMVDQLIASRGRTFIGTFYSTFTGYITRVRGYHGQQDKAEGYELGVTKTYYYIPEDQKHAMREYRPVHGPFWAREFPIGWRDLDKGIGELKSTSA
jgi:hypothetical protein